MEIKATAANLPILAQQRRPAPERSQGAARFEADTALATTAVAGITEYVSRGEWVEEGRQDYRTTLNRLRATQTYEATHREAAPSSARQQQAIAAYRDHGTEAVTPAVRNRFDDYA